MIKKKHLNITIDDVTIKDLLANNVNISGTVNAILKYRKKHINSLNHLIEIIEKIELNINDKNTTQGSHIITEIKTAKPLITTIINYLNYESTKNKMRPKT